MLYLERLLLSSLIATFAVSLSLDLSTIGNWTHDKVSVITNHAFKLMFLCKHNGIHQHAILNLSNYSKQFIITYNFVLNQMPFQTSFKCEFSWTIWTLMWLYSLVNVGNVLFPISSSCKFRMT